MKPMPFYGKIKAGIWRFTAEKIFAAHCREFCKDGDYTLTLSKTIPAKTNEQLGYFHAVVVPVIHKQIRDDAGYNADGKKREATAGIMIRGKLKEVPITEDFIVDMLKLIWAKQYNQGEVKSKADMSIEECSELIDISIMWATQYLGCNIPPPEKTLV